MTSIVEQINNKDDEQINDIESQTSQNSMNIKTENVMCFGLYVEWCSRTCTEFVQYISSFFKLACTFCCAPCLLIHECYKKKSTMNERVLFLLHILLFIILLVGPIVAFVIIVSKQ